jgi:uncharacterized protein
MLGTVLLQIAKTVILSQFDKSYSLDREMLLKKYPFLDEKGAAFVTLKYDNELRGCIGSIISHRKLLDDIIYNAKAAAFSDPRFRPLESSEFEHLNLEVSVLTNPEVLEYVNYDDLVQKVRPNIDGLILKYGNNQGTFLPQVWEQLPNAKFFLEHLSYKAGLEPSVYDRHPEIYRYRVDAIEEKFDAVLFL